MRILLVAAVLLAGLGLGLTWRQAPARDVPGRKTAPAPRPFAVDKRIPWTTSRVVGSPNPPPPYRVKRAFPDLNIPCPIGVAHQPGSDRLILINQLRPWSGAGRVLRIKDDPAARDAEELLAVDGIAYGVAFHPDFAKNGYFYVGSNGPYGGKNKTTRVIRYTMDRKPPYALDPRSATMIIEWESDGHNGGDVAFGPDGMLYITSGDGTSDSDTNVTGQDLTKLLAKVLRIDVDHPVPGKAYAVPADNPFLSNPGVRPETWAYGFRNPWRIHVDRPTGDVWVGNNGQDLWEQIYLVQRGANYGWSVMEGSHLFYANRKPGPTPFSKPIAEHSHSEARSMTGGIVYHGTRLPELRGAYIYGDWSTGHIWGIRHDKGKVTWHQELTSTTLQITGFGTDSHGELLIADHGGGYYYLETAPKEVRPPFPTQLSETGLFTAVSGHQTDPALIPYSVNSPLWSDGADKERFIGLPGMSQIDFVPNRGWNFPDGAVLVKTFSLELEAGDPSSRRRIETRLLLKHQGQWAGYSYLWNDAQTDAELVPATGTDRVYTIRDARLPLGSRQQSWRYPSRIECMVCHSRAANFVLGLSTSQMNKIHDYGTLTGNQLRVLERLGVFRINYLEHISGARQRLNRLVGPARSGLSAAWNGIKYWQPDLPPEMRGIVKDVDELVGVSLAWRQLGKPLELLETELRRETRYSTHLPRLPNEYDRLANPADERADLHARARSYLHSNCAQCHVTAGGGNALMEMEATASALQMNVFGVRPQHHTFGIADARLIVPGQPERSLLYQRLVRRGPGQMPPLATAEVDKEAVRLLHAWISQLPADVGQAPVKKQ